MSRITGGQLGELYSASTVSLSFIHRNFFFPKLPHPDMYFDDTNDFNDRADLIHYVEEYDKLSLTLEDDENTVLVQAQIETTHISSN